ncbi:hypothetical protein L3X38_028443 [Prunus dulcis]|uniref:Uncharacterized protein n=1 Tax=Prunus dulcis TaxID=3755 RepID=A0AAD4Z176_PRUDU|nr:hypothetical protein L3X38_028443 [Prunus dulcis]
MAEKAYPAAPANHGYQRSDAESLENADELKRKKKIIDVSPDIGQTCCDLIKTSYGICRACLESLKKDLGTYKFPKGDTQSRYWLVIQAVHKSICKLKLKK